MEKNVTNGVVCYADILGYLNIINNNDTNKCADIINDIILGIDKRVQEKLITVFSSIPMNLEIVKEFFATRLSKTVVSDTIIFFFDLDNQKNETADFIIITYYLGYFINDCFHNGIPVRASMEYGPFYLKENIFAGKVISEGYNHTENMDFSGLYVSENAYENYIKKFSENETTKITYNDVYHKVLLNFKNGEDKAVIFNWILLDDFNDKDIRQLLFESFQKHNKDIPDSAMKKILNTEKYIRKFLIWEKGKKT